MTMLINSGQMLKSRPTLKRAIKCATIIPSLSLSVFMVTACTTAATGTPVKTIPPTVANKAPSEAYSYGTYSYGARPFYLVDDMDEGRLKKELLACSSQTPVKTDFSISHRGAPLQFPEHTYDGYRAAARMGAGILECDVAFTKDGELVCRHAQNDLHTTTNIVATPLARSCTVPPRVDAKGNLSNAANIECRTSDITAAEFKSLKGKMDAANTSATTIAEYMNATAPWRTDLYSQNGQVLTLKEHIKLAKSLGMKHTPELKAPVVTMPFHGYSLDQYRQQLIDTYKAAGVPASDVYPQSFNIADIEYWLKNDPDFGANAVYLIDDSNETAAGKSFDKNDSSTWLHSMADIKARGINIIAPAAWLLVTSDGKGNLMPSQYAKQAKAHGLEIITWSLERSGPLATGGGWYYTGLEDAINNDGDLMTYIDVLAKEVGVKAIFSDWPATVSYYANCKGL